MPRTRTIPSKYTDGEMKMSDETWGDAEQAAWRKAKTAPRPNLEVIVQSSAPPLWANCKAQVQHKGDTCGVTSCAVVINWLVNKNYTDEDLLAKYGYGLLTALNTELNGHYHYSDTGNTGRITEQMWPAIEHRARNGIPTIMGLNTPYSITGRGHVVCVFKVEGEIVTYTDSAEGPDGHIRTTTKKQIETCALYPNGNFVLLGDKVAK